MSEWTCESCFFPRSQCVCRGLLSLALALALSLVALPAEARKCEAPIAHGFRRIGTYLSFPLWLFSGGMFYARCKLDNRNAERDLEDQFLAYDKRWFSR